VTDTPTNADEPGAAELSPAIDVQAPAPKKRRVPLWAIVVIVALVAVLIAAPASIALYVARQHHIQNQQIELGAWWTKVSGPLEQCSTVIAELKDNVGQGTGTDVVDSGNALEKCLNDVPTTPAPNDTVDLAFATALNSLHAAAAQTVRLGMLMADQPLDQTQPDQVAAYVALTKQFAVAQVTSLSLQQVVRQAVGDTTSPLPTSGP
jgi:flagellar basal body-associated protein FliL